MSKKLHVFAQKFVSTDSSLILQNFKLTTITTTTLFIRSVVRPYNIFTHNFINGELENHLLIGDSETTIESTKSTAPVIYLQ